MSEAVYQALENRGLLQVAGADKASFLQGLVSNDVRLVGPARAVWSALLTPQGKFLHEFFVAECEGNWLLDAEAKRLDDLKRRLSLYKLRSKVELTPVEGWGVFALFGEAALERLKLSAEVGAARRLGKGVVFTDPRLARLGARAYLPVAEAAGLIERAGFKLAEPDEYDRLRILEGIPDGSRDLEIERSTLLENGFDELHGVDWQKGCYMGQELTARIKYRGLVKKRLLPVRIEGPVPPAGTSIERHGKEAGVMRSSVEGIGLATLRLASLEESGNEPLKAGDAILRPFKPSWASF